jgi:primosomal replication protein N
VAVLEGFLRHGSRQSAGGFERDVRCEVPVVAIAALALQLTNTAQDCSVTVTGFLAAKSLKNPRLVLHIQHVEFE